MYDIFEQIYIYSFYLNNKFATQKRWLMSFFGLYWLRKGAYMPKNTLLKKLGLGIFLKSD